MKLHEAYDLLAQNEGIALRLDTELTEGQKERVRRRINQLGFFADGEKAIKFYNRLATKAKYNSPARAIKNGASK